MDGSRVLSTCSKTGPEMRSDKDNSIKLLKTIIENYFFFIWKYISKHPIYKQLLAKMIAQYSTIQNTPSKAMFGSIDRPITASTHGRSTISYDILVNLSSPCSSASKNLDN